MLKIMTPGPTQVRENVREARSRTCTNPDLDPAFYEEYKETCEQISRLLHTDNATYILGGEGILALEAACASLTEQGDRVLVIDNGVYGKGFADFVKMYGGEPVFYHSSYEEKISVDDLAEFLEKDADFKYAALVHCDTPSGVLNEIDKICPLLHEYEILSVVDSVSGMFGNPVFVDDSKIDLICGGSQKALSAPPGLCFVTVSENAMEAMRDRKTPIASFYGNILAFEHYYENKWFPYTMPISDIYGLKTALENVEQDVQILKRHEELAQFTRKALLDMGLELYLKNGFSNTVTVFKVPSGMNAATILDDLKREHGLMLAGGIDVLKGQVLRIGHMGENANKKDVEFTLNALKKVLDTRGTV